MIGILYQTNGIFKDFLLFVFNGLETILKIIFLGYPMFYIIDMIACDVLRCPENHYQ
tara:strand:- start:6351 stop:6521 length:171 start_codon:yes stop_codon:yes gene_type:complete